jgi:hypothetical protein
MTAYKGTARPMNYPQPTVLGFAIKVRLDKLWAIVWSIALILGGLILLSVAAILMRPEEREYDP